MTKIEQLRQGGFSTEEIEQFVEKTRTQLSVGGFDEKEINSYLGIAKYDKKPMKDSMQEYISQDEPDSFWDKFLKSFEPDWSERRARSYKALVGAEKANLSPSKFEPTMKEALTQGYESSVTGLIQRGKMPDNTIPAAAMKYLPTAQRLAMQTATVAGDLPFMTAGALIGGAGGGPAAPLTAMGGAFALPAGLRKVYSDMYQKGQVQSFSEFWQRMGDAVMETMKGEAVGIATAAAGLNVPGMASFPAEIATMTTLGAAMEGTVPEPKDFMDAAILLGGMKASTFASTKLTKMWTGTGEHPYGVVERSKSEPKLQEEILSSNIGKEAPPKPKKIETKEPETAQERILSTISMEEGKTRKTLKDTLHDAYTTMVDDLHPLSRVVKDMSDGKGEVAKDPYKLARLFRGVKGIADHFLEYSPFTFKDKVNVGRSFKEILTPFKGDLDGIRAYAKSKRAIELEGRGIEHGVDIKDAKAVVKDGGKYEQAYKELLDYQDKVLQYYKDSGIISKAVYNDFKDMNKDYVPFYRLMDKKQGGVGKGLEAYDSIKALKGSTLKTIDPLESIIKNTYLFTTLAEKNRIGQSLVKFAAKNDGLGKYVKSVPRKVKPIKVGKEEVQKAGGDIPEESMTIFRPNAFYPKEDQIRVWFNGKEKLFQVHPDIARVFKSLDTESLNVFVKVMSYPAKWLRAGAILSPEFIARNPMRDALSAFVFSKWGFAPGVDLMRGISSALKKDEFYRDWQKSGGMLSELTALDRKYLQNNVGQTLAKYPVLNRIKNPVEALRVLSELSEQGTRIGAFRKARKKGADLATAGYEAREITLDFARIGAKTRALNSMIAFWNANIQGTDKLVRAFKDQPYVTSAKIAAGITIPSVILAAVNHNDGRWDDIPKWQKDLFWIVMPKHVSKEKWAAMTSDEQAEFSSENHIWRIPKPFELGILFGTIPERFTEALLEKNPEVLDGILKSLGRGATPGGFPTVSIPIIENFANKSLFLDRPLIPANREGLLPEYQYNNYTTEITKALGKLLGKLPPTQDLPGIAPVKIENVIRGWTGGLGMHIVRLASFGLEKTGVLPSPERPSKTYADWPVIKAFVVRHPAAGSESVNTFYEDYFKAKKTWDTFNYLVKKELNPREAAKVLASKDGDIVKLDGVYKAISRAHQVLNLIHNNPDMNADEKRQLIDKIYLDMTKMAAAGNTALRQIKKDMKNSKGELK